MIVTRLIFGFVLLVSAIEASGAILVSISEQTITATGLTPGGGAVFFSVAHEPHEAYFKIRRIVEYVPDADRDGIVSYTGPAEVPWKSIWFVVDARTGDFAPGGRSSRQRLTTERPSRIARGSGGDWTRLIHERPWLELLLVRPGGDVWELTVSRGGAADLERATGADYATPVELFRAVTPDARPLQRLTGGDVVIAIDPEEVAYFVLEAQ